MKIAKSRLRKLIREEIVGKRKEDLINEGLLDFLGGLFDKLAGWVSGLGEKVEGFVNDAVQEAESAADKLEPEEGKKLSPEDYMKSVAYTQLTNFESALGKLLEAEKAKTWAPEGDSEEEAETWQKSPDADAAANLWDAVGKLGGSLKFLGNPKYIGDAASAKLAEKLSGKMESPADAIAGVSEAANGLVRIWSSAEKNFDFEGADAQPSEILAVLKKIQSQSKKIAGKISASAKEIKESLEGYKTMKISKDRLRTVIREALSTEVPDIAPHRKSSFQAHKERKDASMAANMAKMDGFIKQVADQLKADPASAVDILTTFQPAVELDKHLQSMEGGLRMDSFLDKIEDDLQAQGVDRVAALKFSDSFLKFR